MSASKKKRRPHLSNKDLALKIMVSGFRSVADEIGDRMTPARAAKIVEYLVDNGHDAGKIPSELKKLAAQKRNGPKGGLKRPPEDGEIREYKVSETGRMGLSTSIIGKSSKGTVFVKFSHDQIVITRKRPA